MPRYLALALPLLLAACTTPPVDDALTESTPVAAPPSEASFAPDRVLVGFADAVPTAAVRVAGLELPALRRHAGLGMGVYAVPSGLDVEDAVEALQDEAGVAWAEPDWAVTAAGASAGDPLRRYQWNLDLVDAEGAWEHSTGEGIVVAVVDTGVSEGPMDGLSAVTAGWDFVESDDDPADDNGHGTHVAGTIAQATGNGVGLAGLAPDAIILPVKVLDAEGSGWTSDVAAGVDWAVDQGAHVVNLSLSSSAPSHAMAEAMERAADAGVFIAAATGNDDAEVRWPAAFDEVVAVGASDTWGERAPYSNHGPAVEVVAPGGDLSGDYDDDGLRDGVAQETCYEGMWSYWLFQGTSMATPHVAAAAALLMAEGATAEEARELLTATALDVGDEGRDEATGHGLIQPAAALEAMEAAAVPPDTTPPVISNVRLSRPDEEGHQLLRFDTDEETVGLACLPDGDDCVESVEGESMTHSFQTWGLSEVVLRAEDAAGNSTEVGPYHLD